MCCWKQTSRIRDRFDRDELGLDPEWDPWNLRPGDEDEEEEEEEEEEGE